MAAGGRWWTGIAMGTLAAVACSSEAAAPDTEPDPCGILQGECPYCTDPGPKQTCETAVASGDPVQCTVALDDTAVQESCVVPDAGGDASPEGSTDAPPVPACDAAQESPDASCECVAPCVVTCPQGGCTVACPAGATCQGSCAGGNCVFECPAGATCNDSCDGGNCTFQCEDGAVCNDTCAIGCVGP